MITIEAVLEDYIYKNEETGYSVASLSDDIKAVGILPGIRTGEKLKLTGQSMKLIPNMVSSLRLNPSQLFILRQLPQLFQNILVQV